MIIEPFYRKLTRIDADMAEKIFNDMLIRRLLTILFRNLLAIMNHAAFSTI
jgi:hypothetical protein